LAPAETYARDVPEKRESEENESVAIVINVGKQSDGCVYELHPLSRRDIRQKYPSVRAAPSVFIGYGTKSEFEELHRSMWKQVAMMLTGLTPRQIESLGGAQIYDPVAKLEIAKV